MNASDFDNDELTVQDEAVLAAIDHPKLYSRSPRTNEMSQKNAPEAPVVEEPVPEKEGDPEENGLSLKKRAQTPRPPRQIEVTFIIFIFTH